VRELETRPSAPPPDTITVAPGTTPKRGKARRAKTAEEIAESKKDRESSVVERKVLTAFTGRKRTKSQKYKRTKRERMAATQEAQREKDEKERTTLRIHEATTVADVAHGLNVNSAEIVKILLDLGRVVTVNQHLDRETIDLIADEFGFDVEESSLMEINPFLELEEIEDEGSRVPRPPVVTVMGHVDHGKTKLMDAIRSADVASREAGGITQHIGAYYVLLDSGKSMCFIDTPGHEAFTAMRARGAMVTDVVVLVVAADDGVMPQTKEAIAHARAAGVPILVAINKIDLPSANPERVKNELAAEGLVPEDWGGQTPVVEISATKKIGIEALLDLIHLQAELLELKANPDKRSRGTIIEARLEQGRGVIATALIQEGTLRVGDPIVAGVFSGKVRALLNEHGKRIPEATPGVPIAILGLSGAPVAGDELHGVPDEKTARELGAKLQLIRREREIADIAHVSLESLFARIEEGSVKDLNLIVKGDVQGSVEVVCESLARIESEKVKVRILHRGVGAISESDIMLASASDAIILGFGVAVPADVIPLQQKERVDIRTYNIIYDAIEDIKKAMLGLLADEEREVILGNLEVLEIFRSSKAGLVIGGVVREGKLIKGRNVRVLRDNRVLANSRLVSLRRFKDEVNEVSQGLECGVGITNFQDIHPRDIIECFQVEKVAATL
jgi:translation initiation factor IF-2